MTDDRLKYEINSFDSTGRGLGRFAQFKFKSVLLEFEIRDYIPLSTVIVCVFRSSALSNTQL